MACIIYPDNPPKFTGHFNINTADPHVFYATHLDNYYYLKFIAEHTQDVLERIQANKEILVAEKKLAFWAKHPQFVQSKGIEQTEQVKSKWGL
jgi:hypothetical protein